MPIGSKISAAGPMSAASSSEDPRTPIASPPSNQRRDRSKPDDMRQRADFALLVFAQLEQERHRYRFQLLHFGPLGIDRRPGGGGIGLAGGVDLSRNGAQRAFDAGPVLLLRRRQFQPLLDAGDLDVAEQRV